MRADWRGAIPGRDRGDKSRVFADYAGNAGRSNPGDHRLTTELRRRAERFAHGLAVDEAEAVHGTGDLDFKKATALYHP